MRRIKGKHKEVKAFIFDIDDTIACLDKMFIETLYSLSLIESDGKDAFSFIASCGGDSRSYYTLFSLMLSSIVL